MRIVEAVKLKSFSKLSRSSYIGDNLSALSEIFKEKINMTKIFGLITCLFGVFIIIIKGNLNLLINLSPCFEDFSG